MRCGVYVVHQSQRINKEQRTYAAHAFSCQYRCKEAVEYIEQLSASLRVEISEIKNFIELIVDIIREITEHSPDPTHLQSGLLSLGIFSTEKAAIFTNIHETQSLEFLQRLNSKLCSPFDVFLIDIKLVNKCERQFRTQLLFLRL
ncbi:hypothetical protein HZS_1693 [Henneguya salminicola]|nr:hypothetical protein HZS_1693 [Henneguya salminicola]